MAPSWPGRGGELEGPKPKGMVPGGRFRSARRRDANLKWAYGSKRACTAGVMLRGWYRHHLTVQILEPGDGIEDQTVKMFIY